MGETAELDLDFKVDSHKIRAETEKILAAPSMIAAAKSQTSFRRLRIKVNNGGDWKLDDWKNTFSCVRRLFPDLKEILFEQHQTWLSSHYFKGVLSEGLNWAFCFGNLKVLKLSIPFSADNAIAFLGAIQNNESSSPSIQALQLTVAYPHRDFVHG